MRFLREEVVSKNHADLAVRDQAPAGEDKRPLVHKGLATGSILLDLSTQVLAHEHTLWNLAAALGASMRRPLDLA